jgi:hypothetical protein
VQTYQKNLRSEIVVLMAVLIFVATLPLRARAAANELSLSPTLLTFGKVDVGHSKALHLVITNKGKSSVRITSLRSSSGKFEVARVAMPKVLAAGGKLTLTVTFAPTAAGWESGHLTIVDSSTDRTITMGGTGVEVEINAAPASLSFGKVDVGKSSSLAVELTNMRSTRVTLQSAHVSGEAFTVSGVKFPLTLAARAKVRLTATFRPKKSGTDSGTLTIAGPALRITLSGTGATVTAKTTLTVSPTALSFGSVTVDKSKTLTLALKAAGGAVTVSSISSNSSLFAVSGASFPLKIASGQSASISVTFKPTSAASASGKLSFSSNASNSPAAESMSGTGESATTSTTLSLSPSTLSFGNVTVDNSKTLTLALKATGGAVTVSSVSSSSSLFSVSGASFPLKIASGQSASISVTFAPTSTGSASGKLSFSSNASNSSASEALSGTGTAAAAHSVTLSWNASTSSVSGYNVYRSTSSTGTYTKLNSSLISTTSYKDATVASGKTYFYATTAVNSKGEESSYSNQAEVSVP